MKLVNLDKLLPADIPPGERVLWFGRPGWISLARRAYRGDLIAIYFGAMAIWNFATEAGAWDGGLLPAAKTLAFGAVALAIVSFLAWLSDRTTLYVITSRRVIMKVGIALPIFFNIPFREITSASVHAYGDGTGDIPLSLTPGKRIAYLNLWPHARPFQFKKPEPAMRSIPAVADVATILQGALVEASREGLAQGGLVVREKSFGKETSSLPTGAVAA